VSYCEGAVLEAWERNASARVGKARETPEEADAGAALDALGEALDRAGESCMAAAPAARPAIEAAARGIRKLRAAERSPEQIEASLARIEKKLLKEAASALPADTLRSVEEDADRRLAGDRQSMEDRALARTRDVLIRRKLRAELGIPRLSLLG